MIRNLWDHLRYAGRRLAKSPGFTTTAVVSLALGIGANTAIFSLVNAVLLSKETVKAPEELLEVYLSTPDFQYGSFSYPDYEDLRDATGEVLAGLAGTRLMFAQADRDGAVETLTGELVTGNYFEVLGVEARLGRSLLPEDDVARGGHPVIMLSHDHWQDQYGGDPGVIGRQLRLGGRAYTVVGVAPATFSGSLRGLKPAIFAPMAMAGELMPGEVDELEARGHHSMFVKARLAQGVPLPRVQAAADAVAAHLREQDLDEWDPQASFLFVPRADVLLYPPLDRFIRAASWLLMAVVGLVLLMACTNLAGFLLARSIDRRKEIAVRLALGAPRRSLAAQLLTETTLLAVLGGVAGVALATALLRLLLTADLPLPLPIDLDLGLDATVLGFSLAISLAAGLLLSLAPALQSFRADLAGTLRSESAGGGQGGKLALRNGLVVVQVAVSLVLLLTAGLFLRSMNRIQSVDPGFGREPTALLTFLIPATRYDQEEGRALADRLVARFERVPGAQAVGLTNNLHLNVLNTTTLSVGVDGVEPPPERDYHSADTAAVDGDFFAAAGIPIVEGRPFEDTDDAGAPAVAIVSQAMAEKFWAGRSPLGQLIRRSGDEPDLLVVGVAGDAKVRSLGEAPRSFVYRPLSQAYSSFLTAVVPTAVAPERTARELLAAAREIDPELFVWEASTMDRHLGIVRLPGQLSALVLSAFAGLALILAVVGLYGIVSYAVAQRRREVGIRMSFGAGGGAVVRLLMGAGLRLLAVGAVIGLGLGLALSHVLSGLLFEVSALDPIAFLAFPAVLLGAGALAALIPALAARRVDPASVLRSE